MSDTKHEAIFYGKEVVFDFILQDRAVHVGYGIHEDPFINKPHIFRIPIKHNHSIELCSCHLNNPPFEAGQYAFLESLNLEVKIEKVVRSTSGRYLYYTDYHKEIIPEEAKERQKEFQKKADKAQGEIQAEILVRNNQKEEIERKNNKVKWYQFWK